MRTLPLVAVLLLVLPACQGRRLFTGEGPAAGGSGDASGTGRGGSVNLTERDLRPVDLYVDAGAGAGAPNARWIVGDDVVVEASREYFGQRISMSARQGAVSRTDDVRPDETVTTLTFVMGRLQTAVENNPRVLIGTGITVSARRTLKVRLYRTTDAERPVALRITATGDASRGHKDQVAQRAPTIQVGGVLLRRASAWSWQPIG